MKEVNQLYFPLVSRVPKSRVERFGLQVGEDGINSQDDEANLAWLESRCEGREEENY
jgi:hypothetical protein